MKRITVELEKSINNSYDIYLGQNILDRIPVLLGRHRWGNNYVVITDDTVASLYGEAFRSTMNRAGLPVETMSFPAGEKSKTMTTLLELANRMIELGCDRGTCLIALGGGVVGDLTGFLASIFMRGISYLQIPTTLLAQVDSSIGGKTGVDIPAGKNMLGTFYQPKAVIIDLAFLDTLPEEEYVNGLAEVVKYGAIESRDLFELLKVKREEVIGRHMGTLELLVRESCRIKKGIVELDERENGLRRILNFGHTIGHAIERALDYRYPHGKAVSLGMAAAARISASMGYLSTDACREIEDLLSALGLPTRLPPGVGPEKICEGLKADKKKQKGDVRFVLLKNIGLPFVRGKIKDEEILGVLTEMVP
jgi:3-dehydroquinate synthase